MKLVLPLDSSKGSSTARSSFFDLCRCTNAHWKKQLRFAGGATEDHIDCGNAWMTKEWKLEGTPDAVWPRGGAGDNQTSVAAKGGVEDSPDT